MSRTQTYPYGLVTYVARNPSEKKGAAPHLPTLRLLRTAAYRGPDADENMNSLRSCFVIASMWVPGGPICVQKWFKIVSGEAGSNFEVGPKPFRSTGTRTEAIPKQLRSEFSCSSVSPSRQQSTTTLRWGGGGATPLLSEVFGATAPVK